MAIFIAILGLVPLSSGFSLIVVMVLYIEREFVPFIDGFVLIVEGFGFFYIILVRVMPAADLSEGLKKFQSCFFIKHREGGGAIKRQERSEGFILDTHYPS